MLIRIVVDDDIDVGSDDVIVWTDFDDGIGVGKPGMYVGDKDGNGVGYPRIYVGDKDGIGVGYPRIYVGVSVGDANDVFVPPEELSFELSLVLSLVLSLAPSFVPSLAPSLAPSLDELSPPFPFSLLLLSYAGILVGDKDGTLYITGIGINGGNDRTCINVNNNNINNILLITLI